MGNNSNYIQQFDSLGSMIIKDLVLNNFNVVGVFEKYGIDYCCNGNRPLVDALHEKKINYKKFMIELSQKINEEENYNERFDDWDLTFLSQYIVNNHHSYMRKTIPNIKAHLDKIILKHGGKYNYLKSVQEEFLIISKELMNHMDKEEKILFSLIKYLEDSKKFNEKPKTGGFGSIKNPIIQMEKEHSSTGTALENIRYLTNNYLLPDDACSTFNLTYIELQDFEKDLHIHIHLENNVLFPRAIELEDSLMK